MSIAPRPPARPVGTIRDCHQDDIHALLSLNGERFVSGSKDTRIKIWGQTSPQPRYAALADAESAVATGYEHWVTCLARSKVEKTWFAGFRDGTIATYDIDGNLLDTTYYEDPRPSHRSKSRNSLRILCFYNIVDTVFAIGTARFIHIADFSSGQLLRSFEAHRNDWVYCLSPIDNERLAVVIGEQLEVWQRGETPLEWSHNSTVIHRQTGQTPHRGRGRAQRGRGRHPHASPAQSRPHISAIAHLSQRHLVAVSFDGKAKVVDIEHEQVVKTYTEHRGRAWSTAILDSSQNLFATSADDRTIKIWDSRQSRSAATLGGHPGRVSSLLTLQDHYIVAGSCPDDLRATEQRALLAFWDLRAFLAPLSSS